MGNHGNLKKERKSAIFGLHVLLVFSLILLLFTKLLFFFCLFIYIPLGAQGEQRGRTISRTEDEHHGGYGPFAIEEIRRDGAALASESAFLGH
jgi:hypothetical protein